MDGPTYLHSEGNFIILNKDNSIDDQYNRSQYAKNIVIYKKHVYLIGDGGDLINIYSKWWRPDGVIGKTTICATKNKQN